MNQKRYTNSWHAHTHTLSLSLGPTLYAPTTSTHSLRILTPLQFPTTPFNRQQAKARDTPPIAITTNTTMSLTNASPLDAAKAASISALTLARLSVDARNHALTVVHDALSRARDEILQANAKDLELASQAASSGELSQSLVKRLDLRKKGKWEDMLKGILDVRGLEDPGMLRTLALGEQE